MAAPHLEPETWNAPFLAAVDELNCGNDFVNDATLVEAGNAFDYGQQAEVARAVESLAIDEGVGRKRTHSDRVCARKLDFHSNITAPAVSRQERNEHTASVVSEVATGAPSSAAIREQLAVLQQNLADVQKREAAERKEKRDAIKRAKLDAEKLEAEKAQNYKRELERRKKSDATKASSSAPVVKPSTIKLVNVAGSSKSGTDLLPFDFIDTTKRLAHVPGPAWENAAKGDGTVSDNAATAAERRKPKILKAMVQQVEAAKAENGQAGGFYQLVPSMESMLKAVSRDAVTLLVMVYGPDVLRLMLKDDRRLIADLNGVIDRLSRPRIMEHYVKEMATVQNVTGDEYARVFSRGCPVAGIQHNWHRCNKQLLPQIKYHLRIYLNGHV